MDQFKSTAQLMLQVPMVYPLQLIQAEQVVMEVQEAVEEQGVQERKLGLEEMVEMDLLAVVEEVVKMMFVPEQTEVMVEMELVLQEQYLVEQAPIMVEMVELELLETILPVVEEMPQELLWQGEGGELDSSFVQEEEVEHLQLTEFLEMELQVEGVLIRRGMLGVLVLVHLDKLQNHLQDLYMV